ncbi:hypothetical protein [Micromonospora sp. NPDC023633]|uniref:hypothetical protein n=1 Tax=Micromonospora sp. NPDC023633 TaxID=3154320 RepID=UPI0033C6A5F0
MTAAVSVPAAGATAPALRLRPVVHASPVDAGIHVLLRRLAHRSGRRGEPVPAGTWSWGHPIRLERDDSPQFLLESSNGCGLTWPDLFDRVRPRRLPTCPEEFPCP